MTPADVERLAHRIAWRYKHSRDPAHSDTYTFNRATLLQFTQAIIEGCAIKADSIAAQYNDSSGHAAERVGSALRAMARE